MNKNIYNCFSMHVLRAWVLGLMLLTTTFLQAQTPTPTDGDYRSAVTSGNWNSASSWQIRTSGSWAAASSVPTTTNNVYLQSGHTITVDANAFCQDFHLNSTATAGAIVVNTGITLQVNRKIRNYTGTTVISTGADGVFYSSQVNATSFSTGITTTGTGKISFVYGGAITTNGEWGANIANWNVEFAIPSGQIATLGTSFKAGVINIISGTVSIVSTDLRPDGGNSGTGTLTVSSGATLRFTNSGNIQRSGTASATSHFGTLTIDGTLEYNGTTVGSIGASTINFNGTVVYSGNAQTLVTKGSNSAGVNPTTYTNLSFNTGSSTTAKTITLPTTVNGKLTFASHALHGITFSGTGSLIYGSNSTLEYAMTNSTQRLIIPEWPATSSPTNVTLINTNANCGLSLPASTTRTITGTLTLNAGTLTINSGNTITMGNNSNIIITTGSLTLNSGSVAMGTMATDIVNVTINGNLSSGGELQGSPVGLVNLTINPSMSYAFSSSGTSNKTVNNFVLNGTFTDDLTQTRTLTVKGNITGTGTSNVGKTIMSGNTTSSNISAATFKDLELNDADGFALIGSPTVTGTLTLTAGKVTLGANNLTAATISGGSSTAYVITNSTGTLINAVGAGATQLFPIGVSTSSYDPASVTPTSASTFTINVKSAFTNTVNNLAKTVTKEWNIASSSPSSTVLALTPSDGAALTTTTPKIGHYTSSNVWEALAATRLGDTWTATTTSFSPFGAGDDGGFTSAVLPIELSNFQVKRSQTSTLLTWTTTSEKDNALFNIEQSTNGTNFQTVGQVKGHGTTASAMPYSFEHTTPSVGINYYRLKQLDLNGASAYSVIRSVLFGKSGLAIKTTLVQDVVNIVTSGDSATPLSIFNVAGQQVLNMKIQGEQTINVSYLPAGLYIVRTGTGEVGRFYRL